MEYPFIIFRGHRYSVLTTGTKALVIIFNPEKRVEEEVKCLLLNFNYLDTTQCYFFYIVYQKLYHFLKGIIFQKGFTTKNAYYPV